MIQRLLVQVILFCAVISIHMFYTTSDMMAALEGLGPDAETGRLSLYFSAALHYTGITYALITSFFAYAIMKYFSCRKTKTDGVIRGVIFASVLFLCLSFAVGFGSSFIHDFYLDLIGWLYIEIKRRIIAVITLLSAVGGYIWIFIKTRKL